LIFFKLFFKKINILLARRKTKKKTSNSNPNLSSLFSFLFFSLSANFHWLFIANDGGHQNIRKVARICFKEKLNRSSCNAYYDKNLCIIDFVLLYIIINIYMGKTKNSNQY